MRGPLCDWSFLKFRRPTHPGDLTRRSILAPHLSGRAKRPRSRVTAVRFMVTRSPGFGSSRTPMTVRDSDGLAMSSRNVHLSAEERAAAPVVRRALLAGRAHWESGERSADAVRMAMREALASEPLAQPDYVSVADASTLQELVTVDGPALLSMAVRFGSTRLIDNEILE